MKTFWSLEQNRLRVFDNRVPRRYLGLRQRKWKYNNEELHDSYFSSSIVQVGVLNILDRSAYRVLVGIPEEKKLLRKPRRRREDNIQIDFKEIIWEGVDWIYVAQDEYKWRAVVFKV
jgi:hypothetical protein